jgi:hypothetical protein
MKERIKQAICMVVALALFFLVMSLAGCSQQWEIGARGTSAAHRAGDKTETPVLPGWGLRP